MEVQSHIKGLCEEDRKVVFDDITTDKTHTVFQFHLLRRTLSCLNPTLSVQNRCMQTWVLATEESTISCMRASDIEQPFGSIWYTNTMNNLAAKDSSQGGQTSKVTGKKLLHLGRVSVFR